MKPQEGSSPTYTDISHPTAPRVTTVVAIVDAPTCRAHGVVPAKRAQALRPRATVVLRRWPRADIVALFDAYGIAPPRGPLPRTAHLMLHADLEATAPLAFGVHLRSPPDTASAAAWRAIATRRRRAHPSAATFGWSCHNLEEARCAKAAGADYAFLSPIFPTASKPGYGPVLGVATLAACVAALSPLPIYALGGIDEAEGCACLRAGAAGVVVMGLACAPTIAPILALIDALSPEPRPS